MAEKYNNLPLASISPGMTIESVYYLMEASEKLTRTGKPYCDLKIRDKTGVRIAKYWSTLEGFASCAYIFLRGNSDEYNGATQIVAKEVVNVDKSEVNEGDFLMKVENIEEYKSTFQDYQNQIKDPTIKAIFKTIFSEKFKRQFFDSPASEGSRYGAIGGALMQSCRVAAATEQMSFSYDLHDESKEMLMAASFIANSGKVFSFDIVDHIPMITLKGSLYGDTALSYQKIILAIVTLKQDKAKARELAEVKDESWTLDDNMILHLVHLILSSRSGNIDPSNKDERISAVLPQTIESMILSQSFLTDDRAASAYDAIKSSELGYSDPNDPFTPYDFSTRRRYLKPNFLSKKS